MPDTVVTLSVVIRDVEAADASAALRSMFNSGGNALRENRPDLAAKIVNKSLHIHATEIDSK